jgi:hypothetical protein
MDDQRRSLREYERMMVQESEDDGIQGTKENVLDRRQSKNLRVSQSPVSGLICIVLWRRGIILYIEYQSVCPCVGIGSPHLLHRKRVCHPLGPKGWGSNSGGPNSEDWTESPALFILCVLCGFAPTGCAPPPTKYICVYRYMAAIFFGMGMGDRGGPAGQ